jgi:hypothetical protein
MASTNDFFTSSPTVVLPPHQPNGYFPGAHYTDTNGSGPPTNGFADPFTPSDISLATTPGALAGRKRSRGDIHAPEEEEEGLGDGSVDTPVTEAPAIPRGKPVYGPGMTLIYPEDPGYSACAESQSGTWLEENIQRQQFQLKHMKRPSISTRKSQRVDASASAPDDLAQLVLPPQMREVTAEPLIDETTRVLGISWTRMDSTEVLQINQAASAKWIQKHYPNLQNVSVWLENSAIPCYLVEALNAHSNQQEYYIFSQDLKEARLVTTDPTQLVPRLKMLPALELAAPGGAITAEMDSPPATAYSNDTNGIQTTPMAMETSNHINGYHSRMASADYMINAGILRGFCSAHEMEMD